MALLYHQLLYQFIMFAHVSKDTLQLAIATVKFLYKKLKCWILLTIFLHRRIISRSHKLWCQMWKW